MKKFIIVFFSLVLFLVIGATIFIFTFDINSYKSRIERALTESSGYTFVINGSVKATRTLESVVDITDVIIKADKGFHSEYLLHAKSMRLQLDLKSLMKDTVLINDIKLEDVVLNLEKNDKGTVNWAPSLKRTKSKSVRPSLKKETAQDQGRKKYSINKITAKNVELSYLNEMTSDSWKVSFPQVTIDQLLNFNGKAVIRGETLSFTGTIRNLWATIQKQQNLNFSFEFSSPSVSGKVAGMCRDLKACHKDTTLNVDFEGEDFQQTLFFFTGNKYEVEPAEFEGQSKTRIIQSSLITEGNFDLANAIKLSYNIEHDFSTQSGKGRIELDLSDESLTQKFGLEPFSIKTNYVLEDGKVLDVSNINAMFNESDLDGAIHIALEPDKKPQVIADLHSHYLKLSNIFHFEESQQTEVSAKEKVFSSDKLDLKFLDVIEGQASLSIDNLSVYNMLSRYPQVLLHAKLADGILRVDLDEGSLIAGGEMVGSAILQDNAGTADLKMSFVAQNLEFSQIVPWKKVLRSGNINADMSLSSKGDSLAALMANLNGYLLMAANEVDITSPVVKKLLPEDSSASTSRTSQELFIKCAVINVPVHDGIIDLMKNVAFETSKFNMIISGTVNLNTEKLSLQLIPYRNRFDKSVISDLNQSVVFEGSFTDPRSKVVDRQNLSDDTKKIQLSAKQALLNSHTKKQISDDNTNASVCRIAMGTSVLKDIDAYFGREKVVETEVVEKKEETEEKASKAEEIGRELLGSLSDVLSSSHK